MASMFRDALLYLPVHRKAVFFFVLADNYFQLDQPSPGLIGGSMEPMTTVIPKLFVVVSHFDERDSLINNYKYHPTEKNRGIYKAEDKIRGSPSKAVKNTTLLT